MSCQDMAVRLRVVLGRYRSAIDHLSVEERDDFLRVAGHADQVVNSLETEDVDGAKIGLYAFSRQVSDSFFVQPEAFKDLAKEIAEVKRNLIAR